MFTEVLGFLARRAMPGGGDGNGMVPVFETNSLPGLSVGVMGVA